MFQLRKRSEEARSSGSEQRIGLFKRLGKIDYRLKIIGINEILLAI